MKTHHYQENECKMQQSTEVSNSLEGFGVDMGASTTPQSCQKDPPK